MKRHLWKPPRSWRCWLLGHRWNNRAVQCTVVTYSGRRAYRSMQVMHWRCVWCGDPGPVLSWQKVPL